MSSASASRSSSRERAYRSSRLGILELLSDWNMAAMVGWGYFRAAEAARVSEMPGEGNG
jgi:hypothetical protein